MKRTYLALVVLLACAAVSGSLSGCGYSTRTTMPGNYKTIHVESFPNEIIYTTESRRNTYFPLLEIDVRNAIVDRFLFDGYLKVSDSSIADLILKGTLKAYQRDALRYTDSDDVEEYRVRVIISMELFDTRKEEVVWREDSFAGEATYFLTGSQVSTEESAVKEAVIDLAKRVVERTVENW